MRRSSIGFATSEEHPELTPEDRAVREALAAREIDAQPLVWSATDPSRVAHDLVVIRSCWDYHHRPGEFLAWADALAARGVRVLNSPATLRRNAHKSYLVELANAGAVVIPTQLIRAGAGIELADVARALGSDAVVIKPAVSASSFHTTRLDVRDAHSEGVFRAAVAARDMLVQPFVDAITQGELSIVFLNGTFSHAVIKRARDGDFRVQEEYGGITTAITPPLSVIAQAESVLRMLDAGSLYARIDGIDAGGRFTLAEAELIEPYLFLSSSDGAVDRFAAAIAARLDA